MLNNNSKIRFEAARIRLANALKDLEKTVIKKIDETSINSQIIDVSKNKEDALQAKTLKQEAVIKNLSAELNNLQNDLEEIGKENESILEKNDSLSSKIDQFRSQGLSFVEIVEKDLSKISEIIQGKNNVHS